MEPGILLKRQPPLKSALLKAAKEAAAGPLYSVACHRAPAGGPNDYYSQAPYWWLDAQGRYVRRDGQVYPSRFTCHVQDMNAMAEAALTLAQAGFYLDKPVYSLRAGALLRVWFLDRETRMNPSLAYGQGVPGVCTGRFFGIIDTAVLLKAVHAAAYLKEQEALVVGLREWFAAYLDWLVNSDFGRQAKAYHNNHAAWWHVQAAAYAAFTGAWGIFDACLANFLDNVLPRQLTAQGAFADEITRADALTYSLFNLEAFALMAELAYVQGKYLALWQAEKGKGHSIRAALDFLLPYLLSEAPWPYGQCTPPGLTALLPLQLGALRLQEPRYARANQLLGAGSNAPFPVCRIGAMCMLPGFDIQESRRQRS